MAAGRYDFTIEQGADFARTITWRDSTGATVNLSGYTAQLKIRRRKNDPTALILFDSEANPDADGTIALGADGTIVLAAQEDVTAALSWKGAVFYDLILTSGTSVATRLLEGRVRLNYSVTHDDVEGP